MARKSISLTTSVIIPALENFKTEADNSIFYTHSQIQKIGESSPVVIDAEDTDILVTAAYVTTRINEKLFVKRKRMCSIAVNSVTKRWLQ